MSAADDLTSQLTDQELRISRSANIDVGAGYPHLALPPWLHEIVWDTSEFAKVYGFPPNVTSAEIRASTDELMNAACRLLGIAAEHAENGFVTFSGSAALDRVIESQVGHGRTVVSTSPCIDIIPGMFSERHKAKAVYVPATPDFDLDVPRLISLVDDQTDCIVLTSPENPTGNIITTEEMAAVASFAADRGITLVLDQCFALINPFDHEIPLLPNVAPPDLNWVFLWDTGKSFGLNEDKLGFIFCSEALRQRLSERLNILQFDVSRRLKFMFKRILTQARVSNYRQFLSARIRSNIGLVELMCRDSALIPVRPDGGSFILLDTALTGVGADELATYLLNEKALGVIRTDSFFHPAPTAGQRDRYIRLALAREQAVLEESLYRITEGLREISVLPD